MFKFTSFKERINARIPRNSRVTLNRKQIFILPTKFGFIYIAMCFVLLIMAINFENSLVYILLFWLISIFVSTMIFTWRNLDNLHLRSAGSQPIFAGDEATFGITVESLKNAHHSLWLHTKDSQNFIDCDAKSNATTYLFVPETQRGRVRLPRFTVETTYPLGIFRAWSYVDLDQTTLCYPRLIASELQYHSPVDHDDNDYLENSSSKKRGVDNFDELKNYETGDSISRIDWKAYAKGNGLLVKTFTEQGSKEIWLNEHDFSGDLETRLSQMCYWILEL
ncbi:MAG: DUF58 domain-containing protein, partial [Wohlfahrtiimonas sp.]